MHPFGCGAQDKKIVSISLVKISRVQVTSVCPGYLDGPAETLSQSFYVQLECLLFSYNECLFLGSSDLMMESLVP